MTSRSGSGPGGTEARSCLYEGTLRHARLDATRHEFSYRVLMAWIDLDELPDVLDAHPLWSARRMAPVRFRRADYHGDPSVPLDRAVRDTVEHQLGHRPQGPVRMLAHLRTWGWSFNPIAFYFAYTPDGTTIDALVAEVTNTPWHERHAYVIPVDAPSVEPAVRFPKALHVSPFMDMDLDHVLSATAPGGEHLRIRMDDRRDDDLVFAAELELERLPLERRTMGRALRTHPLPAQRVSAGIYLEALKLRAKQAPFRTHPNKTGPARATASATPSVRAPVDSTPRSSP